jgi:hypothetical protein
MLQFGNCTLKQLDKTFGLKQLFDESLLTHWLQQPREISDFERQVLRFYQQVLLRNMYDWNETELIECFIGPIFTLVNFTSDKVNFFAERSFKGMVDGIELGGEPDGMVASGFREPEKPYFCFQEYKKYKEPDGDPAGQCLAAMLVAQSMNQTPHPIYGCYVLGREWSFMILQEREYAISNAYLATREDIFDIFRILKVLKQIITELVEQA